ncbi:MAG: glutamine amidotransferase-related protein [Granulosicoccaceae bacterium]
MSADKPLKIGLLETGLPPQELEPHGNYPSMFERLLLGADENLSFQHWAILSGEIPDNVHACDAWLITGSRHGVYEQHDWLEPLENFIRALHQADVPMVGICFGHQLIAQALGGKVEKSDKGWGVSVHRYNTLESAALPSWMQDAPASFDIQCFHQDQVVQLPATADVLAGSNFCPYGMLLYGKQALSFQGHPEFDAAYGRGLLECRGDILGEAVVEAGMQCVDQPIDSGQVARWIVDFLRDRPKRSLK